jgi:hypothetical protein
MQYQLAVVAKSMPWNIELYIFSKSIIKVRNSSTS